MAENVFFKRGTWEEYDALPEKDANTLYFLTDKLQFRMGDEVYGVGQVASVEASGLLSAEDKEALDKLIKSGVTGFTPVDGSIVIDDGAEGKTIGVQLSEKAHNAIKLEDDGLYTGEVQAGDGIELADGNVVSVKPVFEKTKYEVVGLLAGARFDEYGRELRVMFPADAPFIRPSGDVPGRDKDCYYVGIRFFAPSDDVTGFKEGEDKVDPDTPTEGFDGTSSGVDKYGRKYDICWFPVARCDQEGDTWTYLGGQSTPGNCVGWYHTIEWYIGDMCVDSETVRVNLTNPDCHNSLKVSLGRSNAPEGVITWQDI